MDIVYAVINFILKIIALFKNSRDTVDSTSLYFFDYNDNDIY